MRKMLKKIMFVVAIVSIITFFQLKLKSQYTKLSLDNIEALAVGEGGSNIYCIGIGSIDCNGIKVAAKYGPYSIGYAK